MTQLPLHKKSLWWPIQAFFWLEWGCYGCQPFDLCHSEHLYLPAASKGRNDTAKIAMDARPGPGFPATLHWREPRVRLSMKLTTGFADPRGMKRLSIPGESTVAPLRYAPVGMTSLV